MTSTTRKLRVILVFTAIFTFAVAHSSLASSDVHEWYCSDPAGHAQYEKHRRQHHDHNANEIASLVERIFNDSELSAEKRREMFLGLLKDYSAKLSLGVGD